jgi:hypothetical protein
MPPLRRLCVVWFLLVTVGTVRVYSYHIVPTTTTTRTAHFARVIPVSARLVTGAAAWCGASIRTTTRLCLAQPPRRGDNHRPTNANNNNKNTDTNRSPRSTNTQSPNPSSSISTDLLDFFGAQPSTDTDTDTTTITVGSSRNDTSVTTGTTLSSWVVSPPPPDQARRRTVVTNPTTAVVATRIQQLETILATVSGPSMMDTMMQAIQPLVQLQQDQYHHPQQQDPESQQEQSWMDGTKNPRRRNSSRSSSSTTGGSRKGLGNSGVSSPSSSSDLLLPTTAVPSWTYQRWLQAPTPDGSSSSSSSSSSSHQEVEELLSYRLFWVGSDAAVTKLGTGLHQVPLARLQEVFLSVSIPHHHHAAAVGGGGGSSSGRRRRMTTTNNNNISNNNSSPLRITVTEVIRILGPFPNIKNTLQGTCTITATTTPTTTTSVASVSSINTTETTASPSTPRDWYSETWTIAWDSMIDGTGKELIPPNNKGNNNGNDTRRMVPLSILYGDEQIIIASTSTTTTTTTSTTTENRPVLVPESILIWIRDRNMNEKLTALRVV